MPFVHVNTGMPIDVVLAGSGLEDVFLSRVHQIDIGGMSVPILDLEDLVIAKVLAGRPKDLDDARPLWRIHGSRLDAGRICGLLAELQAALTRSGSIGAENREPRTENP